MAALFVDSPEFFKVYLPDKSSERLRIPPTFVRTFRGTIPKKLILEGTGGIIWHVYVQKAEAGLFLKKHWPQFVKDNSLKLGNFLIFRYVGNCTFTVRIFGANACKRKSVASIKKTSLHTQIKVENEEIQDVDKQFHTHMHKESEKTRAAEFVTPKGPHFTASLKHGTRSQLTIPKRTLDANNIKLAPEIMLCDQNGERWPVRVRSWNSGGLTVFSAGWTSFWRGHGMRYGDKCRFIFSCGCRQRLVKEVHVQILQIGKQEPDVE